MGTPKTLIEAIQNGLMEGNYSEVIETHVLDFLRQKFGVAYLALSDEPAILAAVRVLAQDLGVEVWKDKR